MDDDESMEARIIPNIKFRERAFSECIKPRQKKNRSISTMTLNRVQSDSNLSQIDKEKTFASDSRRSGNVMPGELLAKLVVALGGYRIGDNEEQRRSSVYSSALGVHGFSDSQILASEKNFDSDWSIAASDRSYITPPHKPRLRAKSEVRIPIEQSVKVANLEYDQGLGRRFWALRKVVSTARPQAVFFRLSNVYNFATRCGWEATRALKFHLILLGSQSYIFHALDSLFRSESPLSSS